MCIACGALPRLRHRLSNGLDFLQCPRCLLGWWPWPAFDPAVFYDQDYFQGTAATKGYDDYTALDLLMNAGLHAEFQAMRTALGADAVILLRYGDSEARGRAIH